MSLCFAFALGAAFVFALCAALVVLPVLLMVASVVGGRHYYALNFWWRFFAVGTWVGASVFVFVATLTLFECPSPSFLWLLALGVALSVLGALAVPRAAVRFTSWQGNWNSDTRAWGFPFIGVIIGVPTIILLLVFAPDAAPSTSDPVIVESSCEPSPGAVQVRMSAPPVSPLVGQDFQFVVSVSNEGDAVGSVSLSPPAGDSFVGSPSSAPVAAGRLASGDGLGPYNFTGQFSSTGPQAVFASLSYVDSEGRERQALSTCQLTALGPHLEVERRFVGTLPFNIGSPVPLEITVRNTGEAPLYDLDVASYFSDAFTVPPRPDLPSSLGAGTEYTPGFQQGVHPVSTGEFDVLVPEFRYSDQAGNVYSSSSAGFSEFATFRNFLCPTGEECREVTSLIVRQGSDMAAPPPGAPSPGGRPFDLAGSVSTVQVSPGSDVPHAVAFSVDPSSLGILSVWEHSTGGVSLRDFAGEYRSSADRERLEISGVVSVPASAPLGPFKPYLRVSGLDDNGVPLSSVPFEVKLPVSVTWLHVAFGDGGPPVSVGGSISVPVCFSNAYVSPLEGRFALYFEGGAVTGVSSLVDSAEHAGNRTSLAFRLGAGEELCVGTYQVQVGAEGQAFVNTDVQYSTEDRLVSGISQIRRSLDGG